ncbi:MAG: signal peptide peptidase SppA [Gammaproteobacteria bacterium]|jgi:protease-4|nr:signal peptide peptidase SppA [Gammaproteobacteria bacterium]MBT6073840.1 signal peptide peptidase SppA [Gammaproteobacteria bacterium]MBT7754277.1 signal peptide peptidase SppA [Gammaproteobacteria bacterium]MDG2434191.1 signal peptide peptidase SppA [Gammaproteobacteria bacterium]
MKQFFKKLGTFLDATLVFAKRAFVFIFLLVIIGAIFSGSGSKDSGLEIPENSILNVNIQGVLVEELSMSEFERVFAELSDQSSLEETLVSDVITSIKTAKNDDLIKYLLLDFDDFLGGSPSKLQAVAAAIEDFKESEKKVIAYSSMGYTTNSYYLASHADEIHMHDYSQIFIDGYRSYRTYYKSFYDKFFIDANVFKVGKFKAFVEPYFRDSMSDEAKENIIEWMSVLWSSYLNEVSEARGISLDSLKEYINNIDVILKDNQGDPGLAAINSGLIDQLTNKREFRDYLYSLSGDEEDNSINLINMRNYANTSTLFDLDKTKENESNVAVIIASGGIINGKGGPGTIADEDFITLIRNAYNDESVKALVLRVDSGGGSAYASEVIADELEKFKESGRPIVASMGGVAASGGYYISAPADKIYAERATITGSIGVGGFIPTFERAFDQLGIHEDGYSTVDTNTSLLQTLTEKDKAILQMGTENVYQKFISKVSANRNMTLEEVDKIAQGKVWIGEKALEIGLIDVLGDQKAAIEAAAELANISDDYDIIFVERDDPFSEFTKAFGLRILNNTFSIIDYFGYSVKTILNHPLVNWIGIQTKQLEQFNDPRGIYLNCYCEIE